MKLSKKIAMYFGYAKSLQRPDGSDYQTRSEFSPETVTPNSALSISAVWACANLIAGTLATLPISVVRRSDDGRNESLREHPLNFVLGYSPNVDQTVVDFWEHASLALELWGNAYAHIDIGRENRIVGLTPLDPATVRVKRSAQGVLSYEWWKDGRLYTAPSSKILHIRGFGGGPLGGLSTLQYQRGSFGVAQAQNRTAENLHRNGLKISGVLSFKEFLSDENRKIAEQKLATQFGGSDNAGKAIITEGGAEYKAISINPNDAQMLESRQFSVEDICRIFGVPPHMVGHVTKSTSWGSGIEEQTISFIRYTLRRRLKRIEAALEKQLLSVFEYQDGIRIRFNIDGLLRGDIKTRTEAYERNLRSGWMTINEVRALENLSAIDGGDVPRVQMQNVPINQTEARDE